jgi:hypothetical protein
MVLGKTRRLGALSLTLRLESAQKSINARKLAPFIFLVFLAGVVAVLAALLHIRFTGFAVNLYVVALLLGISVFYGSIRKNRRLAEVSYYAALWGLIVTVIAPFTYVFAALDLRLYDDEFIVLDGMLGFDWLRYYEFFTSGKIIAFVLMVAYFSMVPQILFAILYFSHRGKYDRNDELFWTAAISLAITGVLSGIFPAAGALHHFRIGLEHAVHLHDFFALRDSTVTTFALSHMEGIVTFPSFHTVCAILLMYVYRGTRIFIPVVWLNALLLLSTPIFGGHYLVDMVGGGVVALLSIYAANFARARLHKIVTRDANTSGSRAHAAETL